MPIPEYIRHLREKIGHDLLMMPAVAAIIFNDAGEVLLQLRSDNHLWALPGGAIEPGEEPAEAAIREVWEETGLKVIPERISGVYGGDNNFTHYPNGDEVAIIAITFVCRVVGGALQIDDDETLELRYFKVDDLPENIMSRHQIRIRHAAASSEVFFRMPESTE
ncbi:MAG TPA: NUDIX hydrolase [Phototrophicaceae bacterium]|jgi:8-oxo-dGTP pyrophosphatase MutT (NUDIX family)|nr:NUDIX hydrolase [Phototrophicaceae bacterium]